MFRLTREVRLAVTLLEGRAGAAQNGHAGYPPLSGLGHFFAVEATLAGQPDSVSGYLMNIKQIDEAVRRDGLPLLSHYVREDLPPGELCRALFKGLAENWGNLEKLRIHLSPYTDWSILASEHPMVRFSQKFEFSAAHRLHNPELDEAANVALFGKCNNPHGHGHNYEVKVTLRGASDGNGQIMPVHRMEEIVMKTVIQRFDHKFLNIETAEFAHANPTVENIAQTIYKLLKPVFAGAAADLAEVTVWETPKTWCEYSEQEERSA